MTRLQQQRDTLFGIANRTRHTEFREIVGVQAGDVVLLCGGHRLLRLHDFHGIRDACGEPVPRLT